MTEAGLKQLRAFAVSLSKREKQMVKLLVWDKRNKIELEFPAVYDPLFRTLAFAGMVFPLAETRKWLKVFNSNFSFMRVKGGRDESSCGNGD